MPKPIIIFSDCHGSWLTLQALMAKCLAKYPDAEIISLGDNIDRGARSKEVIEWLMTNNIKTCMGNHCDLCYDFYLHQKKGKPSNYDFGVWQRNGAIQTLKSFGGEVPAGVVQWMKNLPLYIIPPEYPNLLLSHTGHGLITPQSQHSAFDAVWERSKSFPKDNFFRIFGHTQMPNVILTETYAQIDTGCAYGGKLSALIWPTKEIFEQQNID